MLLLNKFYTVLHEEKIDSNNAVYLVEVKADCEVYQGHFPHKAVCPGVCNIETIRECAEMLTGEDLYIKTIKQCRLTAVATPEVCPKVDVTISVARIEGTDSFNVVGKIADAATSYMELKGEFTIKG